MNELLATYEQIINSMPNFRVRHSQLEMVKKLDECYGGIQEEDDESNGNNICLIEAPTGTGKSIAYLLAGVINAKRLGKKFIISTATKTLQSQLIDKDIPLFIKYSKLNFSYTLAKGRSNYLCPYQLEVSLSENQPDMLSGINGIQDILYNLSDLFVNKRWDGDISGVPVTTVPVTTVPVTTVPINIDNKIKPLITIDKDRCLGSVCPYNQKDECICPYYKKRNELKYADVIVINHSLLLADILLGGGVVLPISPENYLLCIDEGHTFADIAIDSFTGSFGLKGGILSLNHLVKFIYNPDTKTYLYGIDVSLSNDVTDKGYQLIEELDKILLLFTQNIDLFKDNQLIVNEYLEPRALIFKEYFTNCVYVASELLSKLAKVQDKIKEQLKEDNNYVTEANLSKLGFYIAEIERINTVSQYIINKDESRYNANAKWVELKLNLHKDTEFVINAGLTHVGNTLANKLFSRVYGASLVSATLSINRNFNYYLNKLGLNLYKEVKTNQLPVSFNYEEQAQIVVPRFKALPEYKTRNEFTNELVNYLHTKVLDYKDGYGTLVLFFNKAQLQEVYNLLPKTIQLNILLQTNFIGTTRLIAEHKRNIDKGKPSIIFGLNSFAEGVDLPSLYCIHVVITKLPFEAHKTPLNLVQEYWFNFEGANFFVDVSLPETCIRLIQASGRLIRSETDYGQLTICDNRIITKSYGAMLLNSLPMFNRNYNKDFIATSYHKIRQNI